jgi:hypothetical protein
MDEISVATCPLHSHDHLSDRLLRLGTVQHTLVDTGSYVMGSAQLQRV